MFVPALLQSTEYTGRFEAPKNYLKCKNKLQVSFTELLGLFQKLLFVQVHKYRGLFTDKFDSFQFSRSQQDQHLYFFTGDKRRGRKEEVIDIIFTIDSTLLY